ncbi:CDCA8 [Acanthosepion pharaonis]|uniref:CDCA8 n=1 Tax=Acanthosepion pharaonis TaxID=158019 RepID=A0A812DDY5_ACAPH|nr:CDCA8 [Sepia pharaonis]
MPRKRQVKKVRNVPEVPEGDEGKDLTREEQQQKLQVFLVDFDRKFEEKQQAVQRKIDLTMKRIDTYCQMGIQQIPKSLRKMKLIDFIAAGGTFESALEYLAKKDDDSYPNQKSVDSLRSIGQGKAPSDNQLYSDPFFQKIATDCASIIELENQIPKTSKKTLQAQDKSSCPSTAKKPLVQFQEMTNDDIDGMVTQTLRATRHRNVVNSAMKPASTVRKGSRLRTGSRMMQTPIYRDFKTPAITPKFDPKLPMTPFDRSPRKGERLLSFAGSPVVIQTRRNRNLEKIQENISSVLSEAVDSQIINKLTEVLDLIKND